MWMHTDKSAQPDFMQAFLWVFLAKNLCKVRGKCVNPAGNMCKWVWCWHFSIKGEFLYFKGNCSSVTAKHSSLCQLTLYSPFVVQLWPCPRRLRQVTAGRLIGLIAKKAIQAKQEVVHGNHQRTFPFKWWIPTLAALKNCNCRRCSDNMDKQELLVSKLKISVHIVLFIAQRSPW